MRQFCFTPFPELTTQRLLLRQPSEKDACFIFKLRTDDRVNEYIHRQKPASIEQVYEFIKNINESISQNKSIYWIIVLKNSSTVGTITLWQFSAEENCAEIGYELLPQFQGKGIMQETIETIIAHAFNDIMLKKLYAFIHRKNTASLKLLARNNFKRDMPAEKLHEEDEGLKNMIIYSLINLNA